MPIHYAAIVPHPPLLIPQIGKENAVKMKRTADAFNKVRTALDIYGIETIILISSHGKHVEGRLNLTVAEEYNCSFEDFGDFSTKNSWLPDSKIIADLIEGSKGKSLVDADYNELLDYGSAVPLYLLAGDKREIRIVPISYSESSPKENFNLGVSLAEILQKETKRIAIIASGDLSHCLNKDAPGGYSSRGKKFDAKVVDLLKQNKLEAMLELDEALIADALECGFRSIMVLSGAISTIKKTPQLISYEAPFGVGYLVMGFNLFL